MVGARNKNKLLSTTEIWNNNNNNEQNRKGCFWNNVYMKITVAKNEDVYRQKEQMHRKQLNATNNCKD